MKSSIDNRRTRREGEKSTLRRVVSSISATWAGLSWKVWEKGTLRRVVLNISATWAKTWEKKHLASCCFEYLCHLGKFELNEESRRKLVVQVPLATCGIANQMIFICVQSKSKTGATDHGTIWIDWALSTSLKLRWHQCLPFFLYGWLIPCR